MFLATFHVLHILSITEVFDFLCLPNFITIFHIIVDTFPLGLQVTKYI